MPTSQRIDPGIADMGQEFSVSVAGDNVLPAERLSWGARGNKLPVGVEHVDVAVHCANELAEGVRFELTVGLPPRRFSRPLP
jgi:hypothetical protein